MLKEQECISIHEGPLEIDDRYDYTYEAKNAIGQWEDWEASLAVEFTPSSESSGALLTTDTPEKLNRLNPSKQGLSAEAWIKPTDIIGNTGDTSTVLYHKNCDPQNDDPQNDDPQNDDLHYSLGIQKENDVNYKCFATLGKKNILQPLNIPSSIVIIKRYGNTSPLPTKNIGATNWKVNKASIAGIVTTSTSTMSLVWKYW